MEKVYQVRFTSRETGNSVLQSYQTARRAREVVDLTYIRHAGAKIDAEYLGTVPA